MHCGGKEILLSSILLRNATTRDSAVISLVCNSSVPQSESVFKHLGTENNPSNIYVSVLLKSLSPVVQPLHLLPDPYRPYP